MTKRNPLFYDKKYKIGHLKKREAKEGSRSKYSTMAYIEFAIAIVLDIRSS